MIFHHPSFQNIFPYLSLKALWLPIKPELGLSFFCFWRKWNIFWSCLLWPETPTSKTEKALEGCKSQPWFLHPLPPSLPHNTQTSVIISSSVLCWARVHDFMPQTQLNIFLIPELWRKKKKRLVKIKLKFSGQLTFYLSDHQLMKYQSQGTKSGA